MAEPGPVSRLAGRGNLLAGIVFIAAAVFLGVVLALVYAKRQPTQTVAGPTAPGHHTLDSPYQARPFFHGQAVAESNFAAGHSPPRNLSFAYLTRGYGWLSITDLNTVTPTNQYDTAGLVTLTAERVQYPFAAFLAYGADHFEAASTPQQAVDWIHANAAAAFLADPQVAPTLSYKSIAAIKGLDGIQVYNARGARDFPAAADATALWDKLLTDGHRLWGLIGDDSLDSSGPLSTLGQTAVDVQVSDQTPVLIEAGLKLGAFVDTTGVRVLGVADDNGVVSVITSDADKIVFIGKGGKVLQTSHGTRGDYRVRWNEGYIRAEATRADGARAWTQPIFVNP